MFFDVFSLLNQHILSELCFFNHFFFCHSDYDASLKHFKKCLTLAGGRQRRASVLSSMAYVHHITGDFLTAITEYHQSLALQPDNTLVSELLNLCLEDAFKATVI